MVGRNKEFGDPVKQGRRLRFSFLFPLLLLLPVILWGVADWRATIHLRNAKEALFANEFLKKSEPLVPLSALPASSSGKEAELAREWIQLHEEEMAEVLGHNLTRGIRGAGSRANAAGAMTVWPALQKRLRDIPPEEMDSLPRTDLLEPLLFNAGVALTEEGNCEDALEAFSYYAQLEVFGLPWWYILLDRFLTGLHGVLDRCPEATIPASLPALLATLRERDGTRQRAPALIQAATKINRPLDLPLPHTWVRLTRGNSILWRPLKKEQQARELDELSRAMSLVSSPPHQVLPDLLKRYGGRQGERPFRSEANMLVLSYLNETVTDASLLCAQAALQMAVSGPYKDPSAVEEAAQALVRQMPPDPYTGSPILFRLDEDKLVFYSVGKNMKDDGGIMKERGSPDIIFAVPLSALMPGR